MLVLCYEEIAKGDESRKVYVLPQPRIQVEEPYISRPRFNGKRTVENSNKKTVQDVYEKLRDLSNNEVLNRRVVIVLDDEGNDDQRIFDDYDEDAKRQTEIWGRRHRYTQYKLKPVYEIEEEEELEPVEETPDLHTKKQRYPLLRRRFGTQPYKSDAEKSKFSNFQDEYLTDNNDFEDKHVRIVPAKKAIRSNHKGLGTNYDHFEREEEVTRRDENVLRKNTEAKEMKTVGAEFIDSADEEDEREDEITSVNENKYSLDSKTSDTGKLLQRTNYYRRKNPSYVPTIRIGDQRLRDSKKTIYRNDVHDQIGTSGQREVEVLIIKRRKL